MDSNNSFRRKKLALVLFTAVFALIAFFDEQGEVYGRALSKKDTSTGILGDRTISFQRPLNILSLGGSVTWGANLSSRHSAYPYLLKTNEDDHVFNHGIPGSGAEYPAHCIYSMLGQKYQETIFDVITLEHSINGIVDFDMLLFRLRERFPDALIIYIDYYSYLNGQLKTADLRKAVESAGGVVYRFKDDVDQMDKEQIKETYSHDFSHAGEKGHRLIADRLLDIMSNYEFPGKSSLRLGSWMGGDKCISWYINNGAPQAPLSIKSGGEMERMKGKSFLKVETEGILMEYDYQGRPEGINGVDFYISFMTKVEPLVLGIESMAYEQYRDGSVILDEYRSKYPPAIVIIEQSKARIEEAMQHALKSGIDMKRSSFSEIEEGSIEKGWEFINPLQTEPELRTRHITKIQKVGQLKHGKNYIYILPLKTEGWPLEEFSEWNFRLTGTISCEACSKISLKKNHLESSGFISKQN